MGVNVIGIDAQNFIDKDRTSILAIIWQLVAKIALQKVTIEDCEEIAGEDEADELVKLKPEDILMRWFNGHLVKAGQPKVNNFGKDLIDSKPLLHVMN